MKTTTFRSSWLAIALAGALVAPDRLVAQGSISTPTTHTVRAGETFWTLAETYLGDGNRWREIAAMNPGVSSTKSLSVGLSIRLPGNAARGQVASASVRESTVETFTPRPSSSTKERTMFFGARPAGGFVIRDRKSVMVDSGVPAGVYEAMSAPFVGDSAQLAASGRCLSAGQASSGSRGVQLSESMTIQVPGGAAAAGSRWLLVRHGPPLAGIGQIMIPTGVVRLTRDIEPDAPASAEVVAQFEAVSCTDLVLAVPSVPLDHAGEHVPVSNGVRGRIAWVANESLLPSLSHALLLDVGALAGVRLGDRVTIYGRDGNIVVASAGVVRVDSRSATVLVERQSFPSLAAGLPVRVTEKLP